MKKIITLVLLSAFAINVQAVPIASIDVQFIRSEDNFFPPATDLPDTYIYEVEVAAALTDLGGTLSALISGTNGGLLTSLTGNTNVAENPALSGIWDISFAPADPLNPSFADTLGLRIIEGTTFQLQLMAVSTIGLVSTQTTVSSETFLDGRVVNDVPIPAAAWLFGSALLGLGAIKRRKA